MPLNIRYATYAFVLAALVVQAVPALAQTTITPSIASTFNIDDEDLDDIDFVEDAIDDGLQFFGGNGAATPTGEPLTNDEDDEPTFITFAPVDLTGVTTAELNFSWATTGGFDSGAGFSITALGVAAPVFEVQGAAMGDPTAAYSDFFDSPVVDAAAVLDSGIDLSSVVFHVELDPGFDGDDESIFFDAFSITTSTEAPSSETDGDGADDGGSDDGGDDGTGDDGDDSLFSPLPETPVFGPAPASSAAVTQMAFAQSLNSSSAASAVALSSTASVPEPSAACLLIAAGVPLLGRRRC